jgi:DHA1 family tetracycline resistance protein-like MFS transporter
MQRKHALTFVTITVFLDTIGFGIIVPIMPEYLTQLAGIDLSAASAISGYLMVSFAVTNFLFAPLLGSLSDRYGRRPVLMLSLFFYGVSYLIAGFATALWVLFIGRFLTGITSATYATANALIADVSPPEQRAQNFGLLGLAFGLGFIFGPTIGGIIGAWDLRAPFFVAAALTFINTAYGFFFLKETLSANNRRAFELRRANPLGALRQVKRYPILLGLIIGMFIFNIGHHVYPANWNFYGLCGSTRGNRARGTDSGGDPQIRRCTLCSFRAILRRYRLFGHRFRRLSYERLFMVFGIRICRTFRARNH